MAQGRSDQKACWRQQAAQAKASGVAPTRQPHRRPRLQGHLWRRGQAVQHRHRPHHPPQGAARRRADQRAGLLLRRRGGAGGQGGRRLARHHSAVRPHMIAPPCCAWLCRTATCLPAHPAAPGAGLGAPGGHRHRRLHPLALPHHLCPVRQRAAAAGKAAAWVSHWGCRCCALGRPAQVCPQP